MNTIETIKLDRVPKGKMPVLHASQYDNGRTHGIDLTNLGEEWKLDGTEKLTINERKVDNNICSMDIENTFVGSSHIEFASFLQMCACAGSNFCELRISKGGVDIGTLNFILEVEPDPTADGIESESEIRNLKTQIEAITEEVIGDDYYTAEQTDEAIENATEGKADATYVDEQLNNKMDKANPTGTGSLSLNRKAGSTIGSNSVAMGTNTRATGTNTTALGNDTLAYGENSVAMGSGSTVNGTNSVAVGNHTGAKSNNQFVFGKYNIYDNNNAYVEIVGNGTTAFTKSNARTLDWQGNETLAGNLTYNGNKSLESEISRLDGRIDNLPKPVIFKGTLGVGGTVTELPVASESVEGWEFKCITAGTYAGLELKAGDTVTCFNPPNTSVYEWEKTGSQDTDTDTWRNIKVNGVEKLGNGISSGAVDFEDTANVKFEFDANGNKVRAKLDGIYTDSEVDDLLDDKADADNTYTKAQVDDIVYGILPDDTASDSVANFTTSLELPIKSLEVDVNAVQEAGTPTPSSPKAISGWSAITLDANGTTEVINLGGTYYGGHFTQDKDGHRRFEVTHALTTVSEMDNNRSWYYSTSNGFWINEGLANTIVKTASGSEVTTAISDYFEAVSRNNLKNADDRLCVNTSGYVCIYGSELPTTKSAFLSSVGNAKLVYPLATPYTIDLPDGEPINTLAGVNNFSADTGDSTVVFKCSVNDYVSAHSGGNLLGMGGVYLGGAKSGGGEEETDEGEDTEKVKLDDPKEEIKTIGDTKKLGGE